MARGAGSDRRRGARRALVIAIASASATSLVAPAAADVRVTERKLGTTTAQAPPSAGRVDFSADGRHYAYQFDHDGTWAVILDGVLGPDGDTVDDLGFAGPHALYRLRTGGRWYAFVDGVRGDPYRSIESLAPSADGAHLTYVARTDRGTVVVHDGMVGEAFDAVEQLAVAGARWAYVGRRERARFAVVDGVVSEAFDAIVDLACSADGRRCAYVATSAGGVQQVVSDGRRWPFADDAYGGDLVWTGDGNLLAWWEYRAGQHVVVVEGEATEVPDRMLAVAACRRLDRRGHPATIRIAYVGEDFRRQQFVVTVDGSARSAGPKRFAADSITFGRTCAHAAYRSLDADGARWTIDGVAGPRHDDALAGGFGPDGQRFAYQVEDDGRWRLIVDGVAGESSDVHDGIGPPVWSPDGRRVAYHVLDGDPAVVVDGVRVIRIESAVELHWLADGRLGFGDVDRDGAIVWRELTP
jgi:hypothetical protein